MEVPQEFGAASHQYQYQHHNQHGQIHPSTSAAKTHNRPEESLVPLPAAEFAVASSSARSSSSSSASSSSSSSTFSFSSPLADPFPSRAVPFDRTIKALGESRVSEAMASYLSAYTSLRAGFASADQALGGGGGHAEVPVGGDHLAAPSASDEHMQRALHQHIVRVARETRIEPAAMAAAVIYIERILTQHQALALSEVNASRMALVAMMVAAKMTTDTPYSNKWWAKVSGEFTLDDLNAMEIEFIKLIGFQNLHIEEMEYALHQERAMSML